MLKHQKRNNLLSQELQAPPGLVTVISHLQLERSFKKFKHWLTFPYLTFFPPFLPVMQQLSVIFNQTCPARFCWVLLSLLQLLEHMLCTRAGSHTLWHTHRAPELQPTCTAASHTHCHGVQPCHAPGKAPGAQEMAVLLCALLLTQPKLTHTLTHTSSTLCYTLSKGFSFWELQTFRGLRLKSRRLP